MRQYFGAVYNFDHISVYYLFAISRKMEFLRQNKYSIIIQNYSEVGGMVEKPGYKLEMP